MKAIWAVVIVLGCSTTSAPVTSQPPGSASSVVAPAAVVPVPRGSIAVGQHHACAVEATGKVMCWGQGGGRLGTPGSVDQTKPLEVPGIADVAGVAAGGDTTCAWTQAGQVWCWTGAPSNRQSDHRPRHVPRLDDIVQVVVGFDGACGLRTSGHVACWSRDSWQDPLWPPPEELAGIADAVEIAGDDRHLCARTKAGAVLCSLIGDDHHYLLRDQHMTPLPDVAGATSLAGFEEHFVALLADHRLAIWEISPLEGRRSPVPDHNFHFAKIDAERVYIGGGQNQPVSVCALGRGHAQCWRWGDLEDDKLAPAQSLDPGSRDIALGADVSCTRVGDRARCWGLIGRRGDGATELPEVPVEVKGITDARQLEAGYERHCVVRASGRVACWGGRFAFDNDGKTVIDHEPLEMPGVTDAVEIAMSTSAVCARRRRGVTTCWISEMRGGAVNAIDVPELATAVKLMSGAEICGIDATNHVACTSFEVPAMHPANGAQELADALAHGKPPCVIYGNNELTCYHGAGNLEMFHTANYDEWCVLTGGKIVCHHGSNVAHTHEGIEHLDHVVSYDGQYALLADGTVTSRADRVGMHDPSLPPVRKLAHVVELRASTNALCARLQTGRVECWGPRDYLGAGQIGTPSSPSEVAGLVMGAARAVVPVATSSTPVTVSPGDKTIDVKPIAMTGPFASATDACRAQTCKPGETLDCRTDAPAPLPMEMPGPPATLSTVRLVAMNCRNPEYRRDDEQTFRMVVERGGKAWVSGPLFSAGGNEKYCSGEVLPRWQTRDVIAGAPAEIVLSVLTRTSCSGGNGGGDRDEVRLIVAGDAPRPIYFAPITTAIGTAESCPDERACTSSEATTELATTFLPDGRLVIAGDATWPSDAGGKPGKPTPVGTYRFLPARP